MSTTSFKGRMFQTTVTVDDGQVDSLHNAPEVFQNTLQVTASAWHRGMLPRHFDQDAHSRYGYANRAANYLRDPRKGHKPDLVFSGSLKNDVVRQATPRALSKNVVELPMQSRVLNLMNPIPDDSSDVYVHTRRGGNSRGYPNLKRELTVVTGDEAERLAEVAAAHAAREFGPTAEKSAVAALIPGR